MRRSDLFSSVALVVFFVCVQFATGQSLINFDGLANGSYVADNYSESGLRFVSDYASGAIFRSAPQIVSTRAAWSDPNVLVNQSHDDEIFASGNVPLVMRFAKPIKGVGMRLGCVGSCMPVPTASIKLYDCAGNLRASGTATPRSDFSQGTEVWDSTETTRTVVVDYGSTSVREAIDDLAFQLSTKTETCQINSSPIVHISSHTDGQIVASSPVSISGTVTDSSGYVPFFKINGATVPLSPRSGSSLPSYAFLHLKSLIQGANPIAAMAKNGGGVPGSDSITLNYGPPSTVTLTDFHLTQRGIMQNKSCDVDTPFVAGKYTIVRVKLDARTATGAATYVDQLEMKLYRRVGGSDIPVDSSFGAPYSAVTAGFTAPSELAGIHFWVPGDKVDTAGEYTMRFQAWLGINKVGSELQIPCATKYYNFQETNPVRVLVVPAEVGWFDSVLGQQHVSDAYSQLNEVVRTFPVREGVSLAGSSAKTGVKITSTSPLLFCDGTSQMKESSKWCEGTGYEWMLKDADPAGIRRGDHEQVYGSQTDCAGRNTLGGRVRSAQTFTLPASPVGIFRGGAHPTWADPPSKYSIPFDDNHDGKIDSADMVHYIKEFWDADANPPRWSTDLTKYDDGETYRFFQDKNSDRCNTQKNDKPDEPVAPVVMLWHHANGIVFPALKESLNTYNQNHPSQKFDYAYLAFPDKFHPESKDFGMWGPGSASGNVAWIRVRPDTAMTHELGHNVGGLKDLYYSGTPESDRQVPFWQAYVYNQQLDKTKIYDVMTWNAAVSENFFKAANYKALFDKLVVAAQASTLDAGIARVMPVLHVSGMIGPTGVNSLNSRIVSLDRTSLPDEASLYALVQGTGETDLVEHRIAVENRFPIDGEEPGPLPPVMFDVSVPLDERMTWFEIREETTVLARVNRSAGSPQVELTSPNGGERYDGHQVVTVAWTAQDPDPRTRLTYSVLYSPDDGAAWQVLTTGVTATEFRWHTGSAPSSRQARIRIIASDGFNLGEDTSDGVFSVANKLPVAMILSPAGGRQFLQFQKIPLLGTGFDLDGESLSYTWAINASVVATGSSALVGPLPPGDYQTVLQVEDPAGQKAYATTVFSVMPDSDADGMSDEYEERWGFDPSDPSDSAKDADLDGVSNFEEASRGQPPTFIQVIPTTRQFYFAQVGDGTDGVRSLQTTFVLVNTGGETQATLEFFDSLGRPMALGLGRRTASTSFTFSLKAGESLSLQTPGTGPVSVGYAKVSAGPWVGGTAVFSYSEGGTLMFEAGVPAATEIKDFSLFVDSTAGIRRTGLAFVNLGRGPANVTFRLYDKSFKLIASRKVSDYLGLTFASGYHLARYASEIFPEIDQQGLDEGLLTVESDQPLASVTLRQRDSLQSPFPEDVVTTSAFPVVSRRADQAAFASGERTSYFPQVGDGTLGSFRLSTTFALVNTNEDTSVKLEFFNSDGSPMQVSLRGSVPSSVFNISLPRGRSYSATTAGIGGLQVGYARMTTSGDVGGTAVFSFSENETTMYEAGVPVSAPSPDFTIFVDTRRPASNTGLAFVNAGTQNAEVTFRLYDTDFNLIATKDIAALTTTFGPGQHLARYATQIFPEILERQLAAGVITVKSSQPLAAVTLREHDDPEIPFPADVYLVTIYPVVPGHADQ